MSAKTINNCSFHTEFTHYLLVAAPHVWLTGSNLAIGFIASLQFICLPFKQLEYFSNPSQGTCLPHQRGVGMKEEVAWEWHSVFPEEQSPCQKKVERKNASLSLSSSFVASLHLTFRWTASSRLVLLAHELCKISILFLAAPFFSLKANTSIKRERACLSE